MQKTHESGAVAVGWLKVGRNPERWECAGLGAVEASGEFCWSVLPTCGHAYGVVSLALARRLAQERQGLCFGCWAARRIGMRRRTGS